MDNIPRPLQGASSLPRQPLYTSLPHLPKAATLPSKLPFATKGDPRSISPPSWTPSKAATLLVKAPSPPPRHPPASPWPHPPDVVLPAPWPPPPDQPAHPPEHGQRTEHIIFKQTNSSVVRLAAARCVAVLSLLCWCDVLVNNSTADI